MKKLEKFTAAIVFAGIALFSGAVNSQVPQLINYQGRVSVGGVNFDGVGKFKFALVDGSAAFTYWSNDGTSNGAGEPLESVSINVANGLYSILLGNSVIPGMTGIPASVFNNADVRLRVWFDDGVHGFQRLSPDERIVAVGYAMKAAIAATVPDGSITGNKLANGAAAASLSDSGQSAVPSGGLILSVSENPTLVSAGYVKIGSVLLQGATTFAWSAPPAPMNGTPPSPRRFYTDLWTGTEMIIWGGTTDGLPTGALNTGGRFDPGSNAWVPVTTVGAPPARILHSAVWTGSEMIVWGGDSAGGALGDGARYDPATGSWTPMSLVNAPAARYKHTAVWTGSKMIIWGGQNGTNFLNNGAQYDPIADTWTTMTDDSAPSARSLHTAIWTGSEMIVWGGDNGTDLLGSGGRYSPGTPGSWTPLTQDGAPAPRTRHTALWTGGMMIVWGGGGFGAGFRNDGGRYNPADDTWQAMNTTSAPEARFKHSAVWTGTEAIIWGGYGGSFLGNGGRYSLATDYWTAIPSGTGPTAREDVTAIWTGSRMILWGGYYFDSSDVLYNDTWFLEPVPQTMFLYQRP